MIAAGLVAVRARKRYTGVVLVSVTGLGMVLLFATSGAPDLALTQILVETVTLVAFALVLRRIPSRLGEHNASVWPVARAVLAAAVGVTMALVAIVATAARIGQADLGSLPRARLRTRPRQERRQRRARRPARLGHDGRAVGADPRGDGRRVARLRHPPRRHALALHRAAAARSAARTRRPLVETDEGIKPRGDAPGSQRTAWLVGGQRVRPENRSILLEVIVRILFHSIIIVSLYLLFAGHNLPGGGFAGGLVAGMALVMRYVAGGRYELGAAAPTDAGRLLGAGMSIAIACAIVPLFFGARR